MKRNKLYTVNRWNKPLFMPEPEVENLFLLGGTSQNQFFSHQGGGTYGNTSLPTTASNIGSNGSAIASAAGGKGGGGMKMGGGAAWAGAAPGIGLGWTAALQEDPQYSTDAYNGFSLVDSTLTGGKKSQVGMGLVNSGAAVMNKGLESGNGGMALIGGIAGTLGTIINNGWGYKVNQKMLEAAERGIRANENFRSNASYFDDIQMPTSQVTSSNVYKGGVFTSGKAARKNRELAERIQEAQNHAYRSVQNNIDNIISDQIDNALANYAAYGGPLDFGGGALGLMQQNRYFDTIDKRTDAIAGKAANTAQTAFTTGAKTFADGGLKAAFMDEFGKDPIGAAVRYNQGLEAMAAQEEMRKIEAAKEQEYADMQKRLLNLETENQGLQALMAAQPQTTLPMIPEIPETEETPTSSSTPSRAASRVSSGNATWDYVEDQLRKSGKFNDIQIEGIKYNLQRESALNPDVVGDGGAAFGLGQWHGSRQPKDKSLAGQTKHLIDTLSNFDGKEHWIGKGNYEGFLNARTPEEAHYYIAKGYERPRADIVAKVKRDSDMSLRRLKAFGGELGTNGTDWTNGLLYIDEGGSHEENPFDGVPMGLDQEGVPNLVEEGETVYNNYVFSDRMDVPDFMLKDLGLPKSKKGISFADASKKLAQESEKRPNDPISQDGLEASLSRLAEIQETERMRKQGKEYMGLEGYACGGKMGRKYPWGGWTPEPLVKSRGLTPEELRALAAEQSKASAAVLQPAVSKAASRAVNREDSNRPYGNNATQPSFAFVGPTEEQMEEVRRDQLGPRQETPAIADEMRQAIAREGYTPEISPNDARMIGLTTDYLNGRVDEGYDPYPTWMRYAPAVGSGIMALTDALGLTNKPDYTYADRIAASAERAGYAPKVRYNPIGDYMRFVPLDRMFKQNSLDATARAAERTILNSSMPASTKYAALLANNYNNQLASGNLFRQEQEYNDENRRYVKDFNRKTNMFNSQMGLEASMANARYHQVAQQMGLSGLAQAAALRDSIDARTGAAKSANLTNFLTSLGNIGRENFALNQINSDRSRQYGVYRNGVSEHKRSSKGKKGSRWT